ncbi:BlaI/MecI/CopY family transcriptional regulator [Streptomyces sp. NPDC007971]|uniref:BlaI/MecI/CopY family transcriptional regulator n=1 Tax=Streptomyces sp. NPDC007971 TaxID=3364799 RepID=UPI0036E3C8FE
MIRRALLGMGDPGGRRPNGTLEAEVFSVLQSAGGALTPGEVISRLTGDYAYSTVVTTLSRLHDKGLLSRSRRGRAYAYTPVDDEPGLAARRIHQMLADEPDREAVLSRFVDTLTSEDEQLLRRLLGADLSPDG